ncbi:hypothetical protein [Vibrio alfacsensis]|uniref:hypothetical protein n=1 Tax=Vibrio TaxID=662 RepID=UPI0040697625
MILKKIAHFFAKRGLASHEADTRSAISRYDRAKEASEFRINERMMKLRDRLSSQANKRDEELKEYVNKINEFLDVATEMQPLAHKLYDQMFEAFEVWGRLKLCQQDLAIEMSKRDLLQNEISLLGDALKALDLMAQNDDKIRWQALVSNEPLVLNNAHVKREMRTVEKWQKTQDREYQTQRRRVLSTIRENKTKLNSCRNDIREVREALKPLNDELKLSRNQVRDTYNTLCESWRAAQDAVKSMYVGKCDELYFYIENEVNTHCAPVGWGEMSELKSSFDLYKADVEDLFNEKKKHQEQLNKYSLRIKQARESGDYTSFDTDKSHRNLAYQNKSEIQRRINLVKPKKDQLGLYLFEIRKILDWLNNIKPQSYVENMYKMCEEMQDDGAEMYWRAVNIRTRGLIPPPPSHPNKHRNLNDYHNKGHRL